jgi:hypothetical protein
MEKSKSRKSNSKRQRALKPKEVKERLREVPLFIIERGLPKVKPIIDPRKSEHGFEFDDVSEEIRRWRITREILMKRNPK